jgi:hypothetical protein
MGPLASAFSTSILLIISEDYYRQSQKSRRVTTLNEPYTPPQYFCVDISFFGASGGESDFRNVVYYIANSRQVRRLLQQRLGLSRQFGISRADYGSVKKFQCPGRLTVTPFFQ